MNSSTTLPKVYLRVWAVYPLLVPFYLMGKTPVPGQEKVEGGVPQLADFYLLGLMSMVFCHLRFRLIRPAVPVVGAFACFVCYTAFVNFAWTAVLEDLSLLKSSLFYAYDGLLFLTCLILYSTFKDQFLKVTVYAVAASVILQAILSPLAPHQVYARQAAFFNNENQLGYFCVLAAIIFVLGSKQFLIPLSYQLLFYGAVGYLTMLSQCRAALLALGALTIVSLLGRPLWLLLAAAGLASIYFVVTLAPSAFSKAEERLLVPGAHDTLATRGYDRITNYSEHILFGAGEGAYERFRSDLYGSEIHSSYGTLLFCYGIIGTVIFACGLLFMCKSNPAAALYLIPAFVHGSAHHGLRFAFFWPMLAFLCCIALRAEQPDSGSASSASTDPAFPAPPGGEEDQHGQIELAL